MFDFLMGNKKDRKPLAPPPGYIPPGMPPQIANTAGADLQAGSIQEPDWLKNYQTAVPTELQRSPLATSPQAVQSYEAGLPKAPPGFRSNRPQPAWSSSSAAAPSAAPAAPAAPVAPAASQGPADGIFGRGRGGEWEMFKYQDDMGRDAYGTRPRGSGDPSQIASKATTPGQGLLSFLQGIQPPPQATGAPPSASTFSSPLQGPMPNGQSLDQVAAAAPSSQVGAPGGQLGGLVKDNSPAANLFKLFGF